MRASVPPAACIRHRWRILLSIDNSKKCFCHHEIPFHASKNLLAQPRRLGAVASKSQPFKKNQDMDMNVEAGKSGEIEKKKRGRKPKADAQKHRYMFRLNGKDSKRFLHMFERSGKPSYSAFLADYVLNKPLKVVEINKSTIDFVMLLSSFFAQFRAVKNNFNQMYGALVRNFGEEKALEMIQIVVLSTREFGLLKRDFEEYVTKLREQITNP
ncbi:MAG: hypothetical protein LBV26_03095 [Bacteroidales bacterium]|jgi:hypothetical protein|nr:hypothetical protein [Bacteroidales bacterium]